MRWSSLSAFFLSSSWFILVNATSFSNTSAPSNCRKLPSDPDWPSVEVWNTELKGNEPLMSTTLKHPNYIYEASRVEHVQKAVNFVAKHNVRLSIINAGHDFLGRNDAPSGLLLTVSGLKGVHVLESFTPTANGAEPVSKTTKTNVIKPVPGKQAAVTFGAGLTNLELNTAILQSGLIVPGAAHGDVSVAGGWAQGGGHSFLSLEHGLGADMALEYKVVTAKGDLVVANAVTNEDLFWALRGGGGGTWGVVVEATFKAFPLPKAAMPYKFWLNTTEYDDENSIYDAAAYFCAQTARFYDNRIAGYFFVYPNAVQGVFLGLGEMSDPKQMNAFMDPIINNMAAMPGMNSTSLKKVGISNYKTLVSMFSIVQGILNPRSLSDRPSRIARRHDPGEKIMVGGGILTMDSRLLGKTDVESPKLATAMKKAMPKNLPDGQLRFHLLTGGEVHKLGKDTSVNPAFRKAYMHVVVTGVGQATAPAFRELAPNTGAYVNEAWVKNPDWKNAFWGSNYERLSQIKEKWDPDMLFYVTPGINADTMVVKNGRLCKAEGQKIASGSGPAPDGDNENISMGYVEPPSFPLIYRGKNVPPRAIQETFLNGLWIPQGIPLSQK